jgi:hypothetical protein
MSLFTDVVMPVLNTIDPLVNEEARSHGAHDELGCSCLTVAALKGAREAGLLNDVGLAVIAEFDKEGL